ncbi:MAG: hypothetical protein IJY35_01995 [Clostridia bacterium]|nr:hypothetical protein [Clostridia bacterium]
MKKRILSLFLVLMMLFASCAESGTNGDDTDAGAAATDGASVETEPETETEATPDLPEGLSFTGETFTFGVMDNPNARNMIVMEEITGDALNDAQYNIIESASTQLDANIQQHIIGSSYPGTDQVRNLIAAGDDFLQVANVFCVAAPSLLTEGYLLDYENIPYIDLTKPYWDSRVNEALELAGFRYAAIGDLSITTHDLTYILLFNTEMITNNNLERPYDLVFSGEWTMDKMASMMDVVRNDIDGDGQMGPKDNYGYLSHTKMVLPSFWIGAGETSMTLDAEGSPRLSVTDERFLGVFNKIFDITYGMNTYLPASGNDVPQSNIDMFMQGQALFMDCSLFWAGSLRDMETDFGIIPYPKYDTEQELYNCRVSYYMPPVLPTTIQNRELVGAVLEVTNYLAKKEVTPAYIEGALKGKYARDEESIAMLDLILSNRVVDLGDTLYCANVRDGFFASMFSNKDQNLVSKVKTQEKVLTRTIDKAMEAIRALQEQPAAE